MGIFPYGEYYQVWLIDDRGDKQPKGFRGQFPNKSICYQYIAGKLP